MNQFTIGMLARQTNLNIETIRFYERNQLLPKPNRTPAGYRLYTETDVKRLHFIALAKRHGFTLKEIRDLLDLRVHSKSTCEQVRQKSEDKIRLIEEKIRELKKMKQALSVLVASCRGAGPASDCPILDAFEKDN
ncbi:MAG: heavy metal-responsive transcriptional regulator [FCB group bacterium]|nr:heavy metal-responsive transcriptional regulator [FCB group bacterium]